ncbi:MAG TPA: cupin domain-containing protein, partial [Alphaproteobacteria bacterium]
MPDSPQAEFAVAKASAEELGWFVDAVNRSLADEARIKGRLALFREGVNLTDRLKIEGERGWFAPMLHDLLARGVSVVVNDIGLTAPACAAVARISGIPAEWVFQQNLYVTPREVEGFVPHCDPHVVFVAHLHGRKEWALYDKALDNPLVVDDTKATLVADPRETLRVYRRVLVEPGDCFVIPRGRFHSARALTAGSVHLAIGCAGVRPVDYIWQMA